MVGRKHFVETAAKLVATPPSLAAYAAIRVLMIVAPSEGTIRDHAIHVGAAFDPSRSDGLLMDAFARLYRASLLYDRLHRDGDPCLFVPSCTEYAVRAVKRYGLFWGLMLTGDRFRRCTPLRAGAFVDFP